jgi:osmotically-inducible protein OsmY
VFEEELVMRERIEESAQGRLLGSSYFALRNVGCVYRDGVLTLRGSLPTYYLKQMAQSLVAETEGVTAVVNQIEVKTAVHRLSHG